MRTLHLDSSSKASCPVAGKTSRGPKWRRCLRSAGCASSSSELFIAEDYYRSTAIPELLGIPVDKINEQRLYRSLDKLLPHKEALETHLKNRLGSLFDLEYDLLLYDVTSTYFEGQCKSTPMAQHGHSRDNRSDCKQVCIGLVVSKCGMPLGYEVFEGNRNDVKTWQEIVTKMEARYGKADRIWCGDRGMMSKDNIEFMESENRRYIIGASKGTLKKFERELLEEDWRTIRDGLEVKLCRSPDGGEEIYILCRSQDRREKEKAMHERSKSGSTRHLKRSRRVAGSASGRRSHRSPDRQDHGQEQSGGRTIRSQGEADGRTCRRVMDEE